MRITRKEYLESKRTTIKIIEIRRKYDMSSDDNMLTIHLLCGDYCYYKGIELSYKNILSVRELAKWEDNIRLRIEE